MADRSTLPEPVYAISLLYDTDSGYRRIHSPKQPAVVDDLLQRMTDDGAAAATVAAFTPYLRQYWSVTLAAKRDPYAIDALKDWIYALAHPRVVHLQVQRRSRQRRRDEQASPGLSLGALKVAISAVTRAWRLDYRDPPHTIRSWRTWWPTLTKLLHEPQQHPPPILREHLPLMLDTVTAKQELATLRDHALILVGWSAALSAREIGAVTVADLNRRQQRLRVHQTKGGYDDVVLPEANRHPRLDPWTALDRWLDAADLTDGPIFRGLTAGGQLRPKGLARQNITEVLRAYAPVDEVSSHSLRIGWVVQALADGWSEEHVRRHARYRSNAMIETYRALVPTPQAMPPGLL